MTTRTNTIDEIRISYNYDHDAYGGEWNFKLTFSDGSIETGTVHHDGHTWEAIDELTGLKGIDLRHEDFAYNDDSAIWTNPLVLELDEIRNALATMRDDPEVCHGAEEIQRQMPITQGELAETVDYDFSDLVRLAAHDLYRAQNL